VNADRARARHRLGAVFVISTVEWCWGDRQPQNCGVAWGKVTFDQQYQRLKGVNFGLPYEWLGQFGDRLGRNSSFDVSKANLNPPANGSVAGYTVASNFHGIPPPGVLRSDNTFANQGDGQNTVAPRLGFAWQVLPTTSRFLLRGGYGMYFSRPTGQAFFQSASAAPFALLRQATGATNSNASFQSPFSQPFPTADSFPLFTPYSPTTAVTIYTSPPNFHSALIQQYSLNVQQELANKMLLEVGYVGAHGTHLQRVRSLNQALSAISNKSDQGNYIQHSRQCSLASSNSRDSRRFA
jgi:hypothetical protein